MPASRPKDVKAARAAGLRDYVPASAQLHDRARQECEGRCKVKMTATKVKKEIANIRRPARRPGGLGLTGSSQARKASAARLMTTATAESFSAFENGMQSRRDVHGA